MTALFHAALECLLETEPARKCENVDILYRKWLASEVVFEEGYSVAITTPGRPSLPALVHPRDLPKRSLGTEEGRAALIHAVAHIEFNAINLALDAIVRFPQMPRAYHGDWLRVAAEEAGHFRLLSARLGELDHAYGDFHAHNGLWDMALRGSARARCDPWHDTQFPQNW
jgi:uncharacterized ferritin-like protein (DUF455 family)